MAQTRPMNDYERAFLQQMLDSSQRHGWWQDILTISLPTIGGGFLFAYPIFFAMKGAFLLPNVYGWQSMFRSAPSLSDAFTISFTLMLIMAAYDLFRRIPESLKLQNGIKQDLRDGKLVEQTLEIREVKVFKDPEHGMRILFLRTGNMRVFTIYDYDSSNTTSSKHWLKTKQHLILHMYPHSKTVNLRWSGNPIKTPRAITIKAHPKRWPEPEAWCDIEWENLKSTLTA